VISRLSSVAPMVFMILLAGVSFWLERAVQPGPLHQSVARHDPDFWADNFTIKRFGPDGKLQNTLTASRMEHYPDDDTTTVKNPAMQYHRQPPVTISSSKGLIGKDGKEISLIGDALIVRGGREKTPATHVTTEVLNVFPDDEKASSSHPVAITQGQSLIRGSGMVSDSRTGISVLSGRVTGTIYKNK
jgi:lipopolysaccharide export system protein LptC